MMEVPSSPWDTALDPNAAMAHAPIKAQWTTKNAPVVHIFTHFRLELTVMTAKAAKQTRLSEAADAPRCKWVAEGDLDAAALPSVMRKIIAAGLG